MNRLSANAHPRPLLLAVILAMPLCAGCISTPTADEMQGAATNVSTATIDKASQAISERMADPRTQELFRRADEKYGADIRAASKNLAALAESTNNLVAVAKDSPAALAEAIAEKEAVRTSTLHLSELVKSLERFVAIAKDNTATVKAGIADFQADLKNEDGVFNRQRKAFGEDFSRERAAITEAIGKERAAALKDLDAMAKKAIDQTSEKIKDVVSGTLWLLILFVLVLWGLPFGAGVLVGRLMKKKA